MNGGGVVKTRIFDKLMLINKQNICIEPVLVLFPNLSYLLLLLCISQIRPVFRVCNLNDQSSFFLYFFNKLPENYTLTCESWSLHRVVKLILHTYVHV